MHFNSSILLSDSPIILIFGSVPDFLTNILPLFFIILLAFFIADLHFFELITDLSFGPYKSSTETQQGKDDEARVFYVGATRAKKELHIVHRTEGQYEYEPIFFHERNCA